MAKVTRIPFPDRLLVGEWNGIVYVITTEEEIKEEHEREVEIAAERIKTSFNNQTHYSVNLER